MNLDGFVTPLDTVIYVAEPFFQPPPGIADMNCDGFKTPLDNPFFLSRLAAFFPGPSGLFCAPPIGSPSIRFTCPPLP
jgi:hypothetical protein